MRKRALRSGLDALVRAICGMLVCGLMTAGLAAPAHADFKSACKDPASKPAAGAHARLALLIGNGAYEGNGLRKLNFAANDARAMARLLSGPGLDDFTVCQYVDLKTKADLEAAVNDFVGRIKSDDEVLFYFSGHGFGVEGKGNFFLALDAMGPDKFAQGQDGAKRREYQKDEQGKLKLRADYSASVQDHAISEQWVEGQIQDKGSSVLLIFADACRDLLPDGKKGIGAGLSSNIQMPTGVSGTFRFYSAQINQSSYEPEVYDSGDDKKGKDKPAPEGNSIFSRILLQYMGLPGKSVEELAHFIKRDVTRAAQRNSVVQIPDYYPGLSQDYYLNRTPVSGDVAAAPECAQFEADFAGLKTKAQAGRLLQSDIDMVENGAGSGCSGALAKLQGLRGLLQSGFGSVASKAGEAVAAGIDSCDAAAASPTDPSLPDEVRAAGITDIQDIAFKGFSGAVPLDEAQKKVADAIGACKESVQKNSRVARFIYNIGRALNASALLNGNSQAGLFDLYRAYKFFDKAAQQGYVAAYNDLAVLYENGIAGKHLDKSGKETDQWERKPPDRLQAKENYTRAADLGYAIAQYNLGLKYRYGGIGLTIDYAKAYQLLSRAAEAGYMPAKIEAAWLLRTDFAGVSPDPLRAVKLLKEAASTGSVEAMYRLGYLYYTGRSPQLQADPGEAVLWFARAAELGHVESQWWMADMLTRGEGVPAAQPQAAGRYWRIAAANGAEEAQVQLGLLLQQGKIPFDPDPEKAKNEIPGLFADAIERGYGPAAYEYAVLMRQGKPVDRSRSTVPDKEKAVAYAEQAIELAQRADPSSWAGNPVHEYGAAFLLLDMIDNKETQRRDKTNIVAESRIAELRAAYGDPGTRKTLWVRIFECRGNKAYDYAFDVWDWQRIEPPTTWQFDWFERYYGCRIPQAYRSMIAEVYRSAKGNGNRSFADTVVKKAVSMACVAEWQYQERNYPEASRTKPDRIQSKCRSGSDG